ncbi:MAG: YcxB family protein [Candidatus Pelethousia sp.]|nr:YcxB family protein [Candidatus Pelethousia sp.]
MPVVSYTTSFERDSIRMRSHTSGANTAIKYEVPVRFVDTKSVYALFTAARQFAVVFKGSLDVAQRAELIAFLKEKPSRIKW